MQAPTVSTDGIHSAPADVNIMTNTNSGEENVSKICYL